MMEPEFEVSSHAGWQAERQLQLASPEDDDLDLEEDDPDTDDPDTDDLEDSDQLEDEDELDDDEDDDDEDGGAYAELPMPSSAPGIEPTEPWPMP